MPPKRSDFSWPLLLIGLPFTVLSLIALGLALWQISSHVRSLGWVEHPAVLESLTHQQAPARQLRTRHTSRLAGSYRYTVAGRDHRSEQLTFSRVHAYGLDDWDEEIARQLGEPGKAISIWINPNDPAESVAIRAMRWSEFGAYLIFACGMACGGVFFVSAALNRRRPSSPALGQAPGVTWRTVIIMWLLAPLFATLTWLLWRDGHPVWAVIASLQIVLTLNASHQYGVSRRARSQVRGGESR